VHESSKHLLALINDIFDPFEQVENSTSRKYQGTGLGLALCRNFVDLHGGKIWVDSKGDGQGASFHFIIPQK
jgi:signal transduction histidine kinase